MSHIDSHVEHEVCLFVEWGGGRWAHGGPGCTLHCFSALIIVHLCFTWDVLHV